MNFVFVTPRVWNGKEKWRKEKEALGDWKHLALLLAVECSNVKPGIGPLGDPQHGGAQAIPACFQCDEN